MPEGRGALKAVYRALSNESLRDQSKSLVTNKTLLSFFFCRILLHHQHFSHCPFLWDNGNFRAFLLRGQKRRKGDKLATKPHMGDKEPKLSAHVHPGCKWDRGGTGSSATKRQLDPVTGRAASEMQSYSTLIHISFSFSLCVLFLELPASCRLNTLFFTLIIFHIFTLPTTLQLWQLDLNRGFPLNTPHALLLLLTDDWLHSTPQKGLSFAQCQAFLYHTRLPQQFK